MICLKAIQPISGRARVRTRAPECPQPATAGLQDTCHLPGPQRPGDPETLREAGEDEEAARLRAGLWAEVQVRGDKTSLQTDQPLEGPPPTPSGRPVERVLAEQGPQQQRGFGSADLTPISASRASSFQRHPHVSLGVQSHVGALVHKGREGGARQPHEKTPGPALPWLHPA